MTDGGFGSASTKTRPKGDNSIGQRAGLINQKLRVQVPLSLFQKG